MTVDVDAQGHGVHIAVDQWKGGHELLGCAAEAVQARRSRRRRRDGEG